MALIQWLVPPGCIHGDAIKSETQPKILFKLTCKQIAAKMVDDMLAFPPVIEMTQARRPVFVDRIKTRPRA